eukprot:s2880_g4.t1
MLIFQSKVLVYQRVFFQWAVLSHYQPARTALSSKESGGPAALGLRPMQQPSLRQTQVFKNPLHAGNSPGFTENQRSMATLAKPPLDPTGDPGADAAGPWSRISAETIQVDEKLDEKREVWPQKGDF